MLTRLRRAIFGLAIDEDGYCATCGTHVRAHEGVRAMGYVFCTDEHAADWQAFQL